MHREEALGIVRTYVKNEHLVQHMLAVEAVMREYARVFGEDEDTWGIVGLLHDFDWEIHPNAEQHPQDGAPMLRELGVSEDLIRCILSHGNNTGIPRDTLMAKALYACDEITGLITAVALVRPSRSLHDLKLKSVRKKWKDHRFAAAVDRTEIERGAEDLGIDLWEHVERVIQAMRGIAPALGLEGNETAVEKN